MQSARTRREKEGKVDGRRRKKEDAPRVPLSLTLCVSSSGLKAFLVLGYSAFQNRLTLSRSWLAG